jgi:hypothetical protein
MKETTPMLKRLRDEERGIAMIVSLAVAFVVLILSTVVVAQSIHSLDSSGYDRERLLSVNAAEAGTNYWYAYLQSTPSVDMAADPGCDSGSGQVTIGDVVQSGPSQAAFDSVGTFYAADGSTVMNCSTFSDTSFPSFVKVESTGTINGAPARTIETYVRLTPNYGGFGAAILTVSSTNFQNNFTINGNSGNDGDIYVLNGNATVSNSLTLYGNIFVPAGFVTIDGNSDIKGNLWARDDVSIDNPATVEGAALSSTGDIFGSGAVSDDATAAGDVNDATLSIGGIVTEFVSMPDVPTQTFPVIGYVASDWTGAGYTIIDSSIYGSQAGATNCAKAYSWLKNVWSGSAYTNIVLRIAGGTACTFQNGNNDTISVKGHLAVISDWGFQFSNQSNWNGTSGTIKKVHFISTAPAASCPASGGSNKNIVVGNNTNFNGFTNVSFYTPCKATMNNTNSFSGQVLATSVEIGNQFKMSYKPVLVPGITGVTGFKQDISYIHE